MTARLSSARRGERGDPVAALRELHRAVAALNAAVRHLAQNPDPTTGDTP